MITFRAANFFIFSAMSASAALVGHWDFNEGTGTTAGNAANAAFPGTLTGFTAGSEWTPGPPGQGSAVLMDGVNDYVSTSYTGVTGSAARSFAGWIKYPVALDANLDAIFSYGSNATAARWTVRIGSSAGSGINQLRLEVSGAGVFGGPFLNDNQWHHVAVVQAGATLGSVTLYVDGLPVTPTYNGTGASLTINTTVAAGQEVAIGNSKHSAATYPFQGGMDDIRFYSHALSQAEITALLAPAPAIQAFTSLPGNLTAAGQSATLTWSGTAQPGATWSISPVPGDVTAQTSNSSGTVVVAPSTTTTYTLTVTDAYGTATAQTTVGVNEPQQHPVINEVMAANDGFLADENGDTPDWIELRNPNGFSISAAGYRLRDGGADWVIPANTFIAANGHLRIFASGKDRGNPAQNLHTNFSLTAAGELLELRAPGGTTVVDSLPAGVVFPDNITWGRVSNGTTTGYLATPTPGTANSGAGQPGPRIENVVNGLPGERQPVLPLLESGTIAADSIDQFSGVQGQNGWSYGYAAATTLTYTPAGFTPFPGGAGQGAWSAATQNWNSANTQWGASWERGLTTTPNCDIGADYTLPSTTGGVCSPVRRWTSNFSGPAVLSGFFHKVSGSGDATRWQVFVNGVPVLDSDAATAGMQPYSVLGQLRRFAVPVTLATGDLVDMVCDASSTESSDTSRGWLRVWQNPEAFNAAVHDTALPVSTTFTATGGPVTGATLFYVIGFGAEQSISMTNNAGTWSASIPLTGGNAGDLVRWRISATDSAGGSRTSPPFPSATDSAKYHGTVAIDAAHSSRTHLNELSLFIQNISGSEAAGGARGSLFWHGRLYDNIDFNLHSSASYAKRSWDVDFNRGQRFKFTNTGAGHTDVNILTNWRDRSKLRNPVSYQMFGLAGHPTLHCETVRLSLNGLFHSTCDLTGELNEGSLEDSGYDKNGSLYKMQNLFNSSPGHASTGVEKRTRKWEPGNADLAALLNGLVNLSNTDDDADPAVNNSPRFRFLADNVDVPSLVNFITAMFWSTSYDWGHKNYALYFDADGTRRWTPMVWDLDLSWGHYYDAAAIANTYFDDVIRTNTNDGTIHNFSLNHNQMEFAPPNKNSLFAYALEDPTLKAMILRRLRHLAEQYLLENGPSPEIEGRMNVLTELVDPPGIAESDADLDLRIWGYWNQHQTATNVYTPRTAREEAGRITGTFVPSRRGMIFADSPPLGAAYGGPIPGQSLAAPAIAFGTYDAHPASGNQDHEYIEFVNSSADYVDLTGWTLTGGVTFTFPAGSVISPPGDARFNGRLIVAKSGPGWRTRNASPMNGEGRLVLMAYDGQLASTGETVELRDLTNTVVATLVVPPVPSEAQRWLRVTEVHYNPAAPTSAEIVAETFLTATDFEFIELQNTGTSPLDISGCSFSNGIDFTVPTGTVVASGARVVIARKPTALALRSPGLPAGSVLGGYVSSFDNGGERITLRDSVGEQIESFLYDDKAPWPTIPDGTGPSMVRISTSLDPDLPTSWRASTAVNGNPASSDSVLFTGNPGDDTDADGLTALLEYALGTSDTAAGPFAPLTWNADTGEVSYDYAAAADGVELILETSTDLTAWSTAGLSHASSTVQPGDQIRSIWMVAAPLQGQRFYLRARAIQR